MARADEDPLAVVGELGHAAGGQSPNSTFASRTSNAASSVDGDLEVAARREHGAAELRQQPLDLAALLAGEHARDRCSPR